MDARFRDDPNFNLLLEAAAALEELREQLVFLGGCATSLLVTAVRAESIRATRDVDAVVEVVSAADYHAFERKLVAKGFQPDVAPQAPICRRIRNGVRLDVMPPIPALLGFGNRWYPHVLQSWNSFELAEVAASAPRCTVVGKGKSALATFALFPFSSLRRISLAFRALHLAGAFSDACVAMLRNPFRRVCLRQGRVW